jgi:hypothetical protein
MEQLMPLPRSIIPRLPEVFRDLHDRFGFEVHVEDAYRIVLRSRGCVITIEFAQYGFDLELLELSDPRDESERYWYLALITLRNRDRLPLPEPDSALPPDDKVVFVLRQICDEMLRCCPDMLAGDFGPIQRAGYREFDAYVSSRSPVAVNLSLDDPVSVKFWKADLTWAWDLWKRENPGRKKPKWWGSGPR